MYLSQVVWAACLRFVSGHEADILWECHVGYFLLQPTERWSDLQSVLPGHPKSRSQWFILIVCDMSALLPACWSELFGMISIWWIRERFILISFLMCLSSSHVLYITEEDVHDCKLGVSSNPTMGPNDMTEIKMKCTVCIWTKVTTALLCGFIFVTISPCRLWRITFLLERLHFITLLPVLLPS